MWGIIKLELYKGTKWPSRPDPWVARITDHDERFGYKRNFVNGIDDYTYASTSGARGIWRYFALRPSVYEINEIVSWRYSRRYFVIVDNNGDWFEVEQSEVDEWLKNNTSE